MTDNKSKPVLNIQFSKDGVVKPFIGFSEEEFKELLASRNVEITHKLCVKRAELTQDKKEIEGEQ